ncbi:MAG: META domain-containing protein [Gemmatimonadota bacterium]|uniref:META domain-containing protein n=1 Tax=Candidatus Palauibacter scopulicola TaxID=3056741 RepID=UPI002394ECE7|nr:META domain-containing protein [Candidatus Palauibacter scopulicola]MDE2661950.1 META domain-containing protein [Candidatus Palauibacter scopulicola]
MKRAVWLLVAAGAAAGCGDEPEVDSREVLENATFLTLDGGEITLTQGATTGPDNVRYELLLTADGDLDFDSDVDAVAVLSADHGRERFLTLHAVLSDGEEMRDVSARLIGDRIEVHRAEVLSGMIRLNVRIRRPGDPVTVRPSVDRTPYFALTNRGLTSVTLIDAADGEGARAGGAEAGNGTPAPALHTHEWELESFDSGDWSANLRALREPVTLRFRAQPRDPADVTGDLAGYAGCNRIFGSFRMREAEALRFYGVTAMRRLCRDREADFEQRFLEALRSVRALHLEGDRMTLALGGGAIRFRAGRPLASRAPVTAPDPPGAGSM